MHTKAFTATNARAVVVGRASYEVPHGTSNTEAARVAAALAEEVGEPVRVFCRLCTTRIDLADATPSAAAVRLAAERLNIRIAQLGDRLVRPFYRRESRTIA